MSIQPSMNAAPLFYYPGLQGSTTTVALNEDTRRHVVTVLRMQPGGLLVLTDGKGCTATGTIVLADKKNLTVQLAGLQQQAPLSRKTILAISLLKNAARFEWMLEKVTEIGITDIVPLRCERTERQHLKTDRWNQVIFSACLQSKRYYFPSLHPPQDFSSFVQADLPAKRYVAHCMEGSKQQLTPQHQDAVLLVGPEGDFSPHELSVALSADFAPVSLGASRLRTETAGVVGAVMMCSFQPQ